MTVSEFAFLALGLMLGVASGAAFIVISNARAPAVNEIRLTVTPNAIPRRRRSTLSEDAFSDHAEPARGGPAERPLDDREGELRWVADGTGMRTIVRSAPLPPAGAGDPESGAQGPVRIGGGSPWPAAGRNRLPLPASIVASYPAEPGRDEAPLVAVPIYPERDVAMAALRDSAARAAEIMMRAQATTEAGTATATAIATVGRWDAGFGAVVAYEATGSNGGTNGTRRRSTTLTPLGDGNESAAGGPCDEAERIADERCAVAIRARGQADAADEAVREAQRAYEERGAHANRAAVAAESSDMQVAKQSAQQAFRRARSEASTRDEIESAAASWLTEINRINQVARDAAMQVQRERQASAALMARIERLTVDADVARAAADAAELTCNAARAAVADCLEAATEQGSQPHVPMPPITPFPVAAIAHGSGVDVDEASPLESAVATSENEAAILRLLHGDRAMLDALVTRLGGADPAERRRWQLALAGLVDAIVATSIESSILTFPTDHPFWGEFSQSQSRDVAAALASLGFRFDGLGGWADDRIPSQRDLSLAAGYAGIDPMRIRRWPGEAETAELYRDVSVAADEYLRGAASGLTLGELVSALGRRADALTDVWNDWDRLRPLLLAGAA
ncbi:MAG: hypothetical protein E6J17_01330 [Chloroflexi bacterium]|nr:MAG: hypothetical protein E6J17_01330 [Chloroflexota bacterium]